MKKTVPKPDCPSQDQRRPSQDANSPQGQGGVKPQALKARRQGQGAPSDRRSAEDKLAELKRRLLEISDLGAAGSVLGWDQATYMPKGGAAARGRQGATLCRLAHERSIDPALGRLIDALAPYAERLPSDSDDAALIRVARRDFEKAIKVPAEWVARSNEHGAASYDAWTRARPANDFADHAAVSRADARAQPRIRRLLRALRAHRRSADRRRRRGHDHGARSRSCSRSCGASWCRSCARSPTQPVADDRCLRGALRRSARSSTFGLDGRAAARLRPRPRPARQDAPSVLHARSAPATCASPRACARTTSATRCSRPCTRPATPCTSRASSAALEGTPLGSRRVGRRAREPVAAVGERGRPRPRVLGALLSGAAAAFPGQFEGVPLDTFYRAINKVSAR